MDDQKLIGIDALARTLAAKFPGVNVEMIPAYTDMLFLYRIRSANCDSWSRSLIFHRIIGVHGTEEEKRRLAGLDLG